ncbi:MAG TPA: acyl-CoA dehydrogenase family protein [Burkholderiales bacterium]|nr:acyl-CoA dehydrogenase family protein [Burkholderiales bacterium]
MDMTLQDPFAANAPAADQNDAFVAQNYAVLRGSPLLAAGVPAELGGGGHDLRALSEMLRAMAHACPSTALAFSMHTHIVAASAWRLKHMKAPVAPLLERVAKERVVLVSTGGGDWIDSSGEAKRVEGGYSIRARKPFSSACQAGDILVTSSVLKEEGKPAEVLHFGVSMKAKGVSVAQTWQALGMRGTGSHDVVLEDVFVPEAAVQARRPQGKWHPLFDVLSYIALPLIYSVYFGVAESAREKALELVRRRRPDDHLVQMAGELESQVGAARIALADWIELGSTVTKPDRAATARALTDRTLVARAILGAVDAAMNLAGGAAFYRANGLERLFRDAQGARYHPLQEGQVRSFTGRHALGMEA